jgi:hypothetical protein
LLAAALWQHRLAWRDWLWLAAGGLAVLLPVGGLLDWATWGSPFQSIWLNVVRNTVQGVSGSMGTYTWDFYPEYLAETFQPGAAVMIVLAVVGATRLPALAVAVVVTVAVHSLVPHKEFRFVYLAVAASPILIGAGASALFCRIRPRAGRGRLVRDRDPRSVGGPLGAQSRLPRRVPGRTSRARSLRSGGERRASLPQRRLCLPGPSGAAVLQRL